MKLRRYRGRSRSWVRTEKNRQSLRIGRFIAHVRKTPGAWYLAEVYFSGDRECVASAVKPTIDEAKQWGSDEVRRRFDADRPPPVPKSVPKQGWWNRAGA